MVTRRRILIGLVGLGVVGAGAVYGPDLFYQAVTPATRASVLTAPEAFSAASAGDILLIDIRSPEEWAATGSPQAGHRLDLRQPDFAAQLMTLANGDQAAAIALICARGARSARTANMLAEAGFTNILDIPEGMLGSRAGPGWIERGLPVVNGG